MNEADLCRHLDAQTGLPKAVLDGRALVSGRGDDELAAARGRGARIIAIDAFDDATLSAAGRLVWQAAAAEPVFAVGSQGVEYALTSWWRQSGLLPKAPPPPILKPEEPVLVVSGSCSEITARQISAAEVGGFLIVRVDASKGPSRFRLGCRNSAGKRGCRVWPCGRSERPGLHGPRARGPAIAAFSLRGPCWEANEDAEVVHARIGDGLGRIARTARQRLA